MSIAVTLVETIMIEIEDMQVNINQTFQKAENMLKLINEENFMMYKKWYNKHSVNIS